MSEASIHPGNTASIKLTQKLGFEMEGLKKESNYSLRTGEFEDRMFFDLVNS